MWPRRGSQTWSCMNRLRKPSPTRTSTSCPQPTSRSWTTCRGNWRWASAWREGTTRRSPGSIWRVWPETSSAQSLPSGQQAARTLRVYSHLLICTLYLSPKNGSFGCCDLSLPCSHMITQSDPVWTPRPVQLKIWLKPKRAIPICQYGRCWKSACSPRSSVGFLSTFQKHAS